MSPNIHVASDYRAPLDLAEVMSLVVPGLLWVLGAVVLLWAWRTTR